MGGRARVLLVSGAHEDGTVSAENVQYDRAVRGYISACHRTLVEQGDGSHIS
jgi:hypothetical protein